MGKNERERKAAGKQARANHVARTRYIINTVSSATSDLRRIFHQEDSVLLTDELITELMETQRMPEKDLLEMKQQGFRYCPPRNSFIGPSETEIQ